MSNVQGSTNAGTAPVVTALKSGVPSNQLEAYLAAALPEAVTLLHQTLLPFSVGHKMLLMRYGSPFLTEERVPDVMDLFLAVYVCCRTYDQAQDDLLKPQAEFDEEWARWMKLCEASDPGFDPAPIIQSFFAYLIAGSECPKFRRLRRRGEGRGPDPGAPYLAILFATLKGPLNFSREEALNCPYGWAQWLYLTHLEGKGRIVIEDRFVVGKLQAAAAELGLELLTRDQVDIVHDRQSERAAAGPTDTAAVREKGGA